MRPKPRLLIVAAIAIIAVAVIVNLARKDRVNATPPPHGAATASPEAEPQIDYEDRIKELADRIDTLTDSIDTLADRIDTLAAENDILRDDLRHATHFVNVADLESGIIIDLKYATADNLTGQALYPAPICLLRAETAQKLMDAETIFETLGYRIKIWDGYRPISVQRILYAAVTDKIYFANPENGSRHNRGAAVDITLVDADGNELEMPSGFDDFTVNAHRDNPDMTQAARNNLALLTDVMTGCGFIAINTEWWHFDDCDWPYYPLLDIHLESFAE